MIVYVSDVGVHGSGYSTIGKNLCVGLAESDPVVALSIGYGREEHHFPFRLVASKLSDLPVQIGGLCNSSYWVKAVVLAMDIPMLVDVYRRTNFGYVPVMGIFPVESAPLSDAWASDLWRLNDRLTISEFGARTCQEAGLSADHLPIPPSPSYYYMHDFDPSPVRQRYGLDDEHFVITTVADNQERKNLSHALEAFRTLLSAVPEARYVLVTRLNSPAGWNLQDLVRRLGIKDKVRLLDRTLSEDDLRELYHASDVMLMTSKAEGLCLPMREAQACATIVVGPLHTAMAEQLEYGGFPVETDYAYIDPFGNATRYYPSRADIVARLHQVYLLKAEGSEELDRCRHQGRLHVEKFTWQRSTEIVRDRLNQISRPPPLNSEVPPNHA